MFKVVALLAVVGYVSAGISVRDQIALNDQIATQNAINLNGALRNGILAGHVVSPLGYSVVGVPHLGYHAVSDRDAVALGSQIATQHAINVNGAVTGAIAQNNQVATQNAINAHGAVRNAVLTGAAGVPAVGLVHGAVPTAVLTRGAVVATGEDVHAINDRIHTQIAIEQGIAARNAGILSDGNVFAVPAVGLHSVVGVPALGVTSVGQVASVRDAVALQNQINTQNAINAGLIQG
jgi:hypothetical protein